MEKELRRLSIWLQNMDDSDFGYDPYTHGVLEEKIAQSQVCVCNKIGEYIEEILVLSFEEEKAKEENMDC
tara:strand:- start:851 stop:1060 length:210 start_codon:yes stop_codon:yes gene_type:complete